MSAAASSASPASPTSLATAFMDYCLIGTDTVAGQLTKKKNIASHCLNKTHETLDFLQSQFFQPTQSSSGYRHFVAKVLFDSVVDTNYVQYAIEAALALSKDSSKACPFHVCRGRSLFGVNRDEERSLYFYRCGNDHQKQPDQQLIGSLKKASEVFLRSTCTSLEESTDIGERRQVLAMVNQPLNSSVMKINVREWLDHSVAFIKDVAQKELDLDIQHVQFKDYIVGEDGKTREVRKDYIVGREKDIQKLFLFITQSLNRESAQGISGDAAGKLEKIFES